MNETEKRLFIPLNSDPFYWFQDGSKTWEIRRAKGQFAPGRVTRGRAVELRRGYSTPDSLWGHVGETVVADHPTQILCKVPFKKIMPKAQHIDAAVARVYEILGDKPGPFIAMEIILPKRQNKP